MYPTKQIAVAQMRIQLESMRALFTRAILEARPNPSKDEKMRLYAAHYSVMEGANDIARLAIRTCGGQSMMKHLPLERLYRDSRCGALMLPWTAELVLDRMGRETLYEAGEWLATTAGIAPPAARAPRRASARRAARPGSSSARPRRPWRARAGCSC
jgi:alkylation response protein AidB-like acyl-CoA dehydrogenase